MIGKMFSQLRLVVLTVSMLLIQLVAKSQIEVSVPFNDGFIGLIGNSTNSATNIQRFSTLNIAKAQFVQSTSNGAFQLQGNDINGILRLQLTNGRKVDISGTLNWRVNSGSIDQVFGFIANDNISLNLSAYGGVNYSIQGGSTTGKSNFGFKLNSVTYTLPATGQTVSGNAATPSITDLNNYLGALPRVIAPVAANFVLNTQNQDPGDFSLVNFPNSTLLASVGLVNPPSGVTFSIGTTTGLTRSTGYTSWTGLTRISFTGTQTQINDALASLTITTSGFAGDIKLSVSGTENDNSVSYNPVNGHFYKPVAWPSTGRSGGASVYDQILSDAAAQTYKGAPGYLVTITSAVENSFVSSNTTATNVLIALSDRVLEGSFRWDAGPEAGTIIRTSSGNVSGQYNNWCSGEPNDYSSGEDYVVTNWNNGTCWNDFGPPAFTFPGSISSYIVEFGVWSDPDDNAFLDFYTSSATYVANCPSNQTPAAPTSISAGTNAGAGSVPLVVSVASGMTSDWYASATGGTVLSGGQGVTTFNTPIISGTTTFYAQTRNTSTGCVSTTRTAVIATIVPCTPPQVATVNNQTVCNGAASSAITFSPPNSAGYQWMTLNSPITSNAASGTGQNGITVSIAQAGGGLGASAIYGRSTFPAIYSVPTSSNEIQNTRAGVFTATFSTPVTNPVVLFASVGNPSLSVPVIVSAPFTPIFSSATTYDLPNRTFTGTEGYNIIRIDGTVSTVSFNYTVAEVWANMAFGFEDQNTTYNWTNDKPSIGLAASGTGNILPFNAVNTGTTAVVATITVTPVTGGCAGTPQTFTITVNPSPSITYPNSSYSLPLGQAISPITPTSIGTSFSVSPALPTGLSLNTSTGAITGTPTLLVNASTYTITATATACSATSTLTITVTDPTCNTFAAGDFQTNNNATYASNVYTLTPNQGGQNGSAWNKNRLFLDQNFDISARVYLGNSDAGADGIAFVLQNQSLNAGSSGGGLGYAGITPSFAVEFDTYNNGSHEPVQDHLAIIGNGNASGAHNTYSTPFEVQMEDGQWHTARFVWDAASKNFQVFYDGTRRHNITVDLKANIFGGAPYVYWGFTGATGGATNLQQVQFDSYCYVQQVGVTALAGTNNSNAALAFCEGATVRLQASVSSSYQWFRNGTAITGETGRELVVSTSGAYTVQAVSNQNTTLSEVVNVNVRLLPVIAYAGAYTFERTKAIANIVPTLSGGTATSYSITPALPTGLAFNTTNGTISGTPSVVSASRTYTVTGNTATGCAGTTSFILEVVNAVIPSALSYAPGSQTVRQGTAITNMVPTASGGVVASYSINTALPAGLSFNTTTGIISGTLTAQQTGTVVYTITATNSGGSTSATVTLIYNTAPTDVALSSTSVAENSASVTSVATLSATDADAGDTFTYTLVSGTGDTDNASFTISGTTLSTAAVFDFETKSSYLVRVRVTDAGGLSFEKAFTISVTDVNEAPTNISASANSVAENAASGTSVATFSSTDIDTGDTFTYTLVTGTGDTDNASFTITGTTLSTAAVFDFETKSSYSVRVRVTDAGGLTFERTFTISVTDVNEAPTALALSNASVLENAASGTTVGTLAGSDADAGDTHTYTLVTGTGSTDNASFTITGTTLSTAAVFNFEAKNSYAVRVRVTDAGGLSFERTFTISVTDVNEAPTLTAITDRKVYNVSTSQVVNLAGITAGPETAQSTTTTVSTDRPATFSSISVVGTQIQFTLAPGIVTPQDVVVTVRVRDNGGVANGGVDTLVRTFRLGIDPMPVAAASPNLITLGATSQLSATGASAVNYTWVAVGGSGIVGSGANINVRPAGTTTYAVIVTNSFGYQATIPVLLTVIVDYKLIPNNLVTPNGDGVNDKWVIPNIDMYPDNEVMVYDKAGRAVFAKRGYNNEWDGTVNGKLLKEDAYFYVIKFNKDGALPIRGYVSIVR